MKKRVKVTDPAVQGDVENSCALELTAARVHVNDPLAIGIEEFLDPIRFEPARVPISEDPNEKPERKRPRR
jgi:hypothetical protein